MTSTILVTKLFIPSIHPAFTPRPRLKRQLRDGLHRKLTLVSAPAGFGKSTLVTEWITNLQEEEQYQVAWLSLDAADNDPTRFLTYFIAALRTIDDTLAQGIYRALQSSQPPHYESVLTQVINQVSKIPDKLVLVLDDYHVLETGEIHQLLTFFLENQPPNLHLVIATREDPFLPLPRMRAHGQMTELRAADLRFTRAEASQFLNQTMSLDLSTQEIDALESRTEGWIVGLQLVAISLQGQVDTTNLIQSFTGSHRLVLDYLVEEVLAQQPKEIYTFLLHTSILDRFNGSLCDAVTSRIDSQETLERLERSNLFIIPLDNERGWYRYHQLFVDLLRQRLQKDFGDDIPELQPDAGARTD